MKQPTYDINLPARVRFDPTLCLAAFRVLLAVRSKPYATRGATVGRATSTLLTSTELKRKAVSRWISQLEKQRYIRLYVDPLQGNRLQIYIADYPPQAEEVSSQKGIDHPISTDSYLRIVLHSVPLSPGCERAPSPGRNTKVLET